MSTTDLVTTDIDDLKRLVSAGQITLPDLMTRLATHRASLAEVQEPVVADRPAPKQIVLSPTDRKVLRRLPTQFLDAELPASPRALTEAEREALVPLFDEVKVAKAAVTKAENALKEAMHNHMDALAPSDAPLDGNGHAIAEGEVTAPGCARKVVRSLTGGTGVLLTDLDLQEMEAEGVLTHAQYLRMTHSVAYREPVMDAIMAELTRQPDLLDHLADKARVTPRGTQIRMAAN